MRWPLRSSFPQIPAALLAINVQPREIRRTFEKNEARSSKRQELRLTDSKNAILSLR
jgi:hypothetical protein